MMIRTDAWHKQTIEGIQNALSANHGVIALALFGSAAFEQKVDASSDLDLLLVVSDEHCSQFFPNMDWLNAFGELFAYQQFKNEFYGTVRICLFDFRRIDFVIVTPSKLAQLTSSKNNPLWKGVRILFSHSSEVTQCLAQTWQPPTPTFPSQADFDEMVNSFWFKAMLASYKVLRDDRLIASHLALDLVRDCLVMGMILRDRATGTNIHRDGGRGNQLVDSWANQLTSYSALDLVNNIGRSAVLFDQLASQWSGSYRERRYPLLEWLGYIKTHLKT